MTENVFYWLVGVAIIPALGYAITSIWLLRDIKRTSDELLSMHKEPDKYGFGSQALSETMNDMSSYMKTIAHYTRWMAEQSGKPPPPI